MTGDFGEIFIGCFVASSPIMVVVDDDAPVNYEIWEDSGQEGHDRVMPINIDMWEYNRVRDLHRFLNQTFDKRNILLGAVYLKDL